MGLSLVTIHSRETGRFETGSRVDVNESVSRGSLSSLVNN